MQSPGREPSMEDILASIKKVIAEEKELRAVLPASSIAAAEEAGEDDDVLELDHPISSGAPPEPLLDEEAAGHSRQAFEQLQSVAAAAPAPLPAANPLEDMIREMLRPILKQWLDEHLPAMITPRSSNNVPSALVPVQCNSAKTLSPSTAERTISARKSLMAASSADQFARTWSTPWKVRDGNSGCSLW